VRLFQNIGDPELVETLKNGAVGVIPTDTVYGLVCDAADEQAVARLYSLKRGEHQPGIVIAADIYQLIGLGMKPRYLKAVEQFWPGPVSIIIPTAKLDYLREGIEGLAVRVPSDVMIHTLLTQTGPLLSTSANQPGGPIASTISEAQADFSEQVDFYVDGGDYSGRSPSTLIRIVDDVIEVLREGTEKVGEGR
jgi:L-threonylcarbamoyladenylate synthase